MKWIIGANSVSRSSLVRFGIWLGKKCFELRVGSLLAGSVAVGAEVVMALGCAGGDAVGSIHRSGFTRLESVDTGIDFTHRVSLEALARNRLIEDGSGVAAGDVDGDGLCDLYFGSVEGNNRLYRNLGGLRFEDVTEKAGVRCAGQVSTGVVLVDIDGDGDLDLLVNGLGVGTRLFVNEDGRGRFREMAGTGMARDSGARSLAVADFDGDGDLDVYVVNYRPTTSRDEPRVVTIHRRSGRYEVDEVWRDRYAADANEEGGAVLNELGEPDVLYRNLGGGRFEAVSWEGGSFVDDRGVALTGSPRDWGLSAMFRDINGDGAPDLYVCNDFHSPDRVWLNDGSGRFRAAPATALRKQSWASMAVDFADLDGDGLDEFFVAEMLGVTRERRHTQRDNVEGPGLPGLGWGWHAGEVARVTSVMRNTLFLNLGAGHFAEVANYAGVQASDWSWGAAFLDIDLDGYPDLLVANGHARDHLNSDVQARLARSGLPRNAAERAALFRQIPPLRVAKRAFRNRGDLTFEERGAAWGFDWVGISTGMVLADLDGDGDSEVVLNNLESPAFVFRNDAAAPRVSVRLRGLPPNTAGIGARIVVRAPGLPLQSQEVVSGGRYLSGDDPSRTFAVGRGNEPVEIEVFWRSGRRSRMTSASSQRSLVVVEPALPEPAAKLVQPLSGEGGSWFSSFPAVGPGHPLGASASGVSPLFESVDGGVELGDAAPSAGEPVRLRPLQLPRRLGHEGPGVSWMDLNDDGLDDLVLATPLARPTQIRLNDGRGAFVKAPTNALSVASRGARTALVGWMTGRGRGVVAAGVSGYGLSEELPVSLAVYAHSRSNLQAVAGFGVGGSVGPVAAADMDGDGVLELFVGGQAESGRYPMASRSQLFRQREGRLGVDPEAAGLLADVGLVNGAVWSDLTGDGWPELILACEWGPLRILRNERGRLSAWDPGLTVGGVSGAAAAVRVLSGLTGWWTGVAAGDFDGDGRMDLVVGNWGRNTPYQEFIAGGLRINFGDADGPGGWKEILTHRDPILGKEVPWSGYLALCRALPWLASRVSTHASYATNSLSELLGDAKGPMRTLEAVCLESVVLLNRGNGFEVQALPMAAQLSPVFGVAVADFDNDGSEDVFLGQNCFATDRECGRLDAGRGLLLRGDGKGGFGAVPIAASGIALSGEQRGVAAADFDGDGRMDLAVAQHAAPVRLLRNRGAPPGVRVRLIGPPGNRSGIGAQLRLRQGGKEGPVREVHAGGGYRSQDSSTLVFARPSGPGTIRVRWNGGRRSEEPVSEGAKEVVVDFATSVP